MKRCTCKRFLNSFLPVGKFGFGLSLDSLLGRMLLLVGVLLPLVTVVHTCTAECARQLTIDLGVMFNQLCDGAEFTLALLKNMEIKK